MKLITKITLLLIQVHLYAENIDSLYHESCKILYPKDTTYRFIDKYSDGKLDTISLEKRKIQTLKIDLLENNVSLKTHRLGRRDTRRESPTCFKDKEGENQCIYSSDCSRTDTININFTKSKIISLTTNGFEYDELYRIQEYFSSLQLDLCEVKSLTGKYKITKVTSDLQVKKLPECDNQTKCGDRGIIEGLCHHDTAMWNSYGQSVVYPRTYNSTSHYYIDPMEMTHQTKRNQWSVDIKNYYGFDTTLVFYSPPIQTK